ncbi:MAG: protein kinase [Thermomicrobiales bacterium]|nr:protein kinase [Thermomicrobiales bacterium]
MARHYEIDLARPLGQGGMSIVYLGRDLKARRLVALRTLRPEYRRDPATRARFRQEARRMAFIQHPNVAHVFDFQETDEAPWAVIEYVPGDSLREIIDDQGPQPVDVVARWVIQIADALAKLHAAGLVHLDIKPQNIIVTDDGTIKLIDFGLAQPANMPQELLGGMAFGTAAYLSPEQASGEPVSAASDVYSLGCVVYELLTGEPPFVRQVGEDRSSDLIHAHLYRMPTPPSEVNPAANVPPWVDEVLLWALDKQPEYRFDDVKLFADLFVQGADGMLRSGDARSIRREVTQPIDARRTGSVEVRQAFEVAQPVAATAPPVGKRAVRSVSRSSLPRKLWRLVLALLVANALLAGVLYFQRGTIPGIYDGDRTLQPGGSAIVIAESLNVRVGPGLTSEALFSVPNGTEVSITGDAIVADGETWWPIEVEGRSDLGQGYLWQGGLQSEIVTGRDRLEHLLGEQLDDLADRIRNRLN